MDRRFAALSSRIRAGTWALGARLPTRKELSECEGVSRAVVREAVARLVAHGPTTSRQGSGVIPASRACSAGSASPACCPVSSARPRRHGSPPRRRGRLSRRTGDPRYAAYADREFHATAAFLLDPLDRLLYRDIRFLERRGAGGRNLFRTRGKGWTVAGLTRFLDVPPARDPRPGHSLRLLQTIAAQPIAVQKADGYRTPCLPAAAQIADLRRRGLRKELNDAR